MHMIVCKIPMSHTWVEDKFIAKSKKEAQNGLVPSLVMPLHLSLSTGELTRL